MKINEITPTTVGSRVSISGKIIVPLSEPRQTAYGPVYSTKIGDESGEINVAIWDEDKAKIIEKAAVGDELTISGRVSMFQNAMNINVSKTDQFEYLPQAPVTPPPEKKEVPKAGLPTEDVELLMECAKMVLESPFVLMDKNVRERLKRIVGS